MSTNRPVSAKESIVDVRQFQKKVLKFSDAGDIAKGGTTTGKIDTNLTIHGIAFICTDAGVGCTRTEIAEDIGNIVIRANGTVLREYTGLEILDLYKHYNDDKGAFTPEGVLAIEFSQGAFDLAQLNNQYALGMLSGGRAITLTYEINFLSPTALRVDRIQVRAIIDDRVQELAAHVRIQPRIRKCGSTGLLDIGDLPTSKGSVLAQHFVLDSGAISAISVEKDDQLIYNDLPRTMLEFMLNNAGRKVQSGYFHLPYNLDNDPRSKVVLGSGVAHWLIQPNVSTAPTGGSFKIIEESEHVGIPAA